MRDCDPPNGFRQSERLSGTLAVSWQCGKWSRQGYRERRFAELKLTFVGPERKPAPVKGWRMPARTRGDGWSRAAARAAQITDVERQIASWQHQQDGCERIASIPGVGLLTATAAVATIGEASTFRSGRQFAAYLGLVPRQPGTGGRVQRLGISKRGDIYLRTLLIHGARAVLANSRAAKDPNTWVGRLIQRRHHNVAAVALANKMARQIWALLVHHRRYDPKHGSTAMATAAEV